ncbi:hypothetical protein Lalb_Chr14g0374911 [Lupinus albus]|uniref:Uncharacterized protein n=1 Tax=Lupinus albus TaxID=3870 RepID=A0A6A4PGM4_LUPAL|nr:hypothetical protein Lalb_Chr14g0374911 [Lupinus albus]
MNVTLVYNLMGKGNYFEDDGTSSTKKWKRPKKDAADQSDQGTATVAQPGSWEQSGFDLSNDTRLNNDPPVINKDNKMEHLSNDTRLNNAEDLVDVNQAQDLVDVNQAQDPVDVNYASEDANVCDGNSMAWEALGLNPPQEICQENSTNEDFDDESVERERPAG